MSFKQKEKSFLSPATPTNIIEHFPLISESSFKNYAYANINWYLYSKEFEFIKVWQKYPYYGQDTYTLEDSCVEIWWAKERK